MNPSNARQNIFRLAVALMAIALLVAVRLANRGIPDKLPSNLTTSRLVTAEGEKTQGHPGQIEPQAADPTPPDWALYVNWPEKIKPVPGETYPDFQLRGARSSNASDAVGLHVPE
jgi:hypothetical protein